MPQIIPDTLPSKASQGESQLYEILSAKLPDDFIVWYEPKVKDLYPDFIILGPNFGLLILEVKGWYASQIERADNNFFSVRWKRGDITKVETYQNPLKQGHGYFGSVSDRLKEYPILCNPNGNYQGRLCFPVGVGAVMSNINEAQARDENLYVVLEKPAVAYRDELLSWTSLSSSDLVQRLKSMFKTDFSFAKLTGEQTSTIKGIIHPEMAIKEVPATQSSLSFEPEQPLPPTATVLLSLDAEQERLARKMKGGHRLISGVAGSGKTLILTARAKALANRLTEQRVLILCYNITLASHLRSQLHQDARNPQYKERIEVLHFHAWAKKLLGRLPSADKSKFKDREAYDEHIGQQLLAKLQALPAELGWDSILVDEAHTFSQNWFTCCVEALKDPDEGDLLIVSDGSQKLYKRRKFSWVSVGIKAQGRTKRLDANYRNTQEILTAAWSILQSNQNTEDATFPAVEPKVALRNGLKPSVYLAASKTGAVNNVIQKITTLLDEGYSPSDVAILYRRKFQKDNDKFNALLDQLKTLNIPYYWITETNETKRNYNANHPGLRIVTTLSSLGLEFKVVLLLWVEQFEDCQGRDIEQASLSQRELYVAMTRAQDELYLFTGGPEKFLNSLGTSVNFNVK